MPSDLSPLDVDKACLSCFLKYPESVSEYIDIIKPSYFGRKVNREICSCIYLIYKEKSGLVDALLLKEKLYSLGITRFDGELSSSEWIDVIVQFSEFVQKEAIEGHFENLIKYNYLREVRKKLHEGINFIESSNASGNLGEISLQLDKILSEATTAEISDDEEPIDIWAATPEYLHSWKNRTSPLSIPSGWDLFEKWYGSFVTGELIVIAAPAKTGKSTFLSHAANAATSLSNTICLILDTELDTELVVSRNFQAHTEIHELTARKGLWDANNWRRERTNKYLSMIPDKEGKIFHLKVGNRTIEEIINVTKRFYHKNVAGKDLSFLLIYDYIKLGSEKVTEAWKEYQVLGRVTDQLKILAGLLPNTCVLTAVQTNREGKVASSSQIEWFCSNLFSLVKKTPEEISQHGKKYGTHKLTAIRTRIEGEEGNGMQLVEIMDGNRRRYEENFINFNSENFKVTEVGSYEDIVNDDAGQLEIEEQVVMGNDNLGDLF